MSNYFNLFFEKIEKGDKPHIPESAIEINRLSGSIDGKGIGQLTPNCISAEEICFHADAMIGELEKIKRQAIEKYKNEVKSDNK